MMTEKSCVHENYISDYCSPVVTELAVLRGAQLTSEVVRLVHQCSIIL